MAGLSAVRVPEIIFAIVSSSVRRAVLLGSLAETMVTHRDSMGHALTVWLDGNESDFEELTKKLKVAGVRWPIVALLTVVFLSGFGSGRRTRR